MSAPSKRDDPACAEEELYTSPRTRRPGSDPDVIVVVGGKEFEEYSYNLRSWSDYFDAAFRSGMKESKYKRFEFPDRNPEEWSWILSLVAPMSSERLTNENFLKALPWFDELCSRQGLDECDRVLSSEVLPEILPANFDFNTLLSNVDVYKDMAENFEKVLGFLRTSHKYSLPKSKASCSSIVCHVLNNAPFLALEGGDSVRERLVSVIKDDPECLNEFWPAAGPHRNILHTLINSEMGEYLLLFIFTARATKQIKDHEQEQINEIINKVPGFIGRDLRRELKNRSFIVHLFPDNWNTT